MVSRYDVLSQLIVNNLKSWELMESVFDHGPSSAETDDFSNCVDYLLEKQYIICKDGIYSISPLGREVYYDWHIDQKERNFEYRRNHRLSMLGAITGIIGGATGLIALLLQLFQNTLPTVL